jgi:hypothetical protein
MSEPQLNTDVSANTHEVSYVKLYFPLIMGVLVLLLGTVMVLHAINWDAFGLWFPVTMVLFGLIIIGGGGAATLLGLIVLLSGCSILLHQSGVVTFPYLKEVLGWVFIVAGTLMVTKSSLQIWSKWKRQNEAQAASPIDTTGVNSQTPNNPSV